VYHDTIGFIGLNSDNYHKIIRIKKKIKKAWAIHYMHYSSLINMFYVSEVASAVFYGFL